MKYKGKIGLWWFVLIILFNIFIGYITYITYVSGSSTWVLILNIAIALITNIFIIPFTINNYVTLELDKLIIHFGFFKTHIAYSDILSLEETKSPIAGSALSFDRIMITTKQSKAIISIKNKKQFIEEIIKHNTNVQYK
ncbi:PH domain-containing protein [Abyssisolibacter fermentans]|uniref:PH domain-containing protein n=1 Tax=Abyssisolibacter fermentans TaxID=1766203 RepID=UPI00082ED264|nr:PH domain-containing protein [Abyssisolibacter fermentans]